MQLSKDYKLNNPSISSTFIDSEGKLKIFNSSGNLIPYSDLKFAIEAVEFYNSSPNPSGTRSFSISIGNGQVSYLPSNGHYYEYVSKDGISWTAARDAAALKKHYGLQGYLATLTSEEEAQLAGAQAPGTGWIGGSDAETEGTWKWVTGPEAGTIFWRGEGNGTTTAPFNYANWNAPNEPNDTGDNEDYAHITAPAVGNLGTWNDLPLEGNPITTANGNYFPRGYIVEYGGTTGDPTLLLSASTTLKMAKITKTTPATRCGNGTVILQATAENGTVYWYDSQTATTPIATGNSFSTPTLSSTTSFYVDAGCISSRVPIIATINSMPDYPQIGTNTTNPVAYCLNKTAMPLEAIASTNCVLNWYTSATGGTASAISPTPSTTMVGTTKYYVSQTDKTTGCEGPRAEIIVTVNPLPTAVLTNNISYCQNQNTSPLVATAAANCSLNWYNTATGGIPSSTSPTPSSAVIGTTKFYVSQTENTTGCEGPRTEITVTINPLAVAPTVNNKSYCNNEITSPLTATASANCSLNWYTSATGGTASATSPTPSSATVGITKYYVSQTDKTTGCEGSRSEIIVTVNPLPIVNNISIFQCDGDLIPDGKTLFNLTVKNDAISGNYNNEIFTYYTTLNGANNALASDLIANELAFENTTPTSMDIWARVTNKLTGCFSVAKISLIVSATNIPANFKIIVPPVCDDLLDSNGNNNTNNNDRDGISSFDLSATKVTIQGLLPTTEIYNINYYRNEADALAEINNITDITNYRNIGYPNTQDIWVRVDSQIENACFGLGPYINLKVEALPIANPVIISRQCDDNDDGILTFNTSTLESDLLQGQTNVTVTYFDSNNNPLKDANGVSISSPFPPNFTTTSQLIKAVVTNNTPAQCYDETTIEFIVDKTPQAFPINSALTTSCDDEINPLEQDGKYAFDTTGFDTTILGGQTGMTLKFYDENGALLPSPLPNPFVTGTQKITAKVENPNNPNCTALTIIEFNVQPLPKIDINLDGSANELVCSNLSTFYVTLDAGITDNTPTSDYNYIWEKDGTDLGINAPTLDVNKIGNYTVEVINNVGCSRRRTINVNASNIATITSIDIVELSDENSITVNVTGPGDYEFSLDEPTNFWQDSNQFNNIPAGIHEVYINDKNGCGVVSKSVIVVGIPKYFTPNNDSYNDYWGIKGMIKYPNAYVQIFDRYGKLIKYLNNANPNWDGTFNGALLPANDYWYVIKLEEGRPEIRGHFTLKR
ncbi:T9SS type B sorting domain-containing protein [Flavobacterium nitratireducens]|uniref:Ig-like domain-containing protein n=1 Tax=Flavobacterium nitratireducens TaxID=992289 RepID=UPI0024150D87|nr:T9SS type B sorting domain-containing protein [Flavobacterium nitratireducens]